MLRKTKTLKKKKSNCVPTNSKYRKIQITTFSYFVPNTTPAAHHQLLCPEWTFICFSAPVWWHFSVIVSKAPLSDLNWQKSGLCSATKLHPVYRAAEMKSNRVTGMRIQFHQVRPDSLTLDTRVLHCCKAPSLPHWDSKIRNIFIFHSPENVFSQKSTKFSHKDLKQNQWSHCEKSRLHNSLCTYWNVKWVNLPSFKQIKVIQRRNIVI